MKAYFQKGLCFRSITMFSKNVIIFIKLSSCGDNFFKGFLYT